MIKSEFAKKGVVYRIKTKKGWLCEANIWPGEWRVKKELSDTETGVIVAGLKHGLELDLPAGIEFYEVGESTTESVKAEEPAKPVQLSPDKGFTPTISGDILVTEFENVGLPKLL